MDEILKAIEEKFTDGKLVEIASGLAKDARKTVAEDSAADVLLSDCIEVLGILSKRLDGKKDPEVSMVI